MPENQYAWESEVRDNEIDAQGIVNNANYLVYMQHARHKHLKTLGVDFSKAHEEGFDFVLVHVDISFTASLKSGDEFIVTSTLHPNGRIRCDFAQEVIRKRDGKVTTKAISTVVCLDAKTGRPVMPTFLKRILTKHTG